MTYSIKITNTGLGPTDNNTVVITDQILANTAMVVSGTPVTFADGTPVSGLALNPANVQYSSDSGVTYTYIPAAGPDGADPNVTNVRIAPVGQLNASDDTNNPNCTVSFQVIVK